MYKAWPHLSSPLFWCQSRDSQRVSLSSQSWWLHNALCLLFSLSALRALSWLLSISPWSGRAWLSAQCSPLTPGSSFYSLWPGPGLTGLTWPPPPTHSAHNTQPRVRVFSLNIETKLAGLLNYRARGVLVSPENFITPGKQHSSSLNIPLSLFTQTIVCLLCCLPPPSPPWSHLFSISIRCNQMRCAGLSEAGSAPSWCQWSGPGHFSRPLIGQWSRSKGPDWSVADCVSPTLVCDNYWEDASVTNYPWALAKFIIIPFHIWNFHRIFSC